jgi:hypothetical protein
MMLKQFWRIEFRKTAPFCMTISFIIFFYVLFAQKPFGIENFILIGLSSFQGMLLAICIFRDSPGTRAFLFSRSLSRKRLFFYRWYFGIMFQIFTFAVLLFIMASGLRQFIQVAFYNSTWFPFVRWHETSSLIPASLCSVFCFQITMFFILKRELRASFNQGKINLARDWTGFYILLIIINLLILPFNSLQFFSSEMSLIKIAVIPYLLVLILFTNMASLHIFKNLEVNA